MLDVKGNKLLCCILAMLFCFIIVITTYHSTSLYEVTSLSEAIENTKDSDITEDVAEVYQPEQSPSKDVYTYDAKWKPKEYPKPEKHVMKAIMSNVIIKQEKDTQKSPKTHKVESTITNQKILLTAIVNSGMMDYTLNWIESLERTEQAKKFLVFAIDQGVVDIMTEMGYPDHVVLIPDEWFHVALAADFALWKSNDYRPITHAKTLIVERLLYLDVFVWFTDVDIVFLSPYILDTMLIEMKQRPNTHMIFSQEVDQRTINSGFYMIKPSMLTKQFMARIIEGQDDPKNKLTQQKVMNRVLRTMFPHDLLQSPYRYLNMMLFPNGNYFFRMNLPTKLDIKPMMVHANYLVGDNKKKTLEKAGLWYNKMK